MQNYVQISTPLMQVPELRRYVLVKRLFDIVVSAVLLVALSLVFAVCALAVYFDSRGPVFFRQARVGERGQVFTFLKFRSMYANADQKLHQEYVSAFIMARAKAEETKDGALYKLVHDPRITRVGGWLRKTSLDELPQLWNVLKGEMSLVGPRPPIPYELEHYGDTHLQRLAVKPGITGLWQISGRSRTTFEEMVALDLEYISKRSLAFDLRILLMTIPCVLLGRDAR